MSVEYKHFESNNSFVKTPSTPGLDFKFKLRDFSDAKEGKCLFVYARENTEWYTEEE